MSKPVKDLPINRLLAQLARDGHLTFQKKCRDLFMQVFGHEALIPLGDTADIGHCKVFDIDLYRFSELRWEYIALRKLFNPAKLLEFALTAPLELLTWGVQRFIGRAEAKRNKNAGRIKNEILRLIFIGVTEIFIAPIKLLSPVLNIAVNLVTGVIRRFLAPVRYLVRPAIQAARNHPWSFAAIFSFSLGLGIFLAVTVLTGGIPVALAGLFLAGSLAGKLAGVAFIATAVGAVLTKALNILPEFIAGVKNSLKFYMLTQDKRYEYVRNTMRDVDARNQQLNYPLNLRLTDKDPDKTTLDKEKGVTPLLIKNSANNKIFIYGQQGKKTQLKELPSPFQVCHEVFLGATLDQTTPLDRESVHETALGEIYESINIERGHIPVKKGSTDKITEALHGIDSEHVDVQPLKKQTGWYKFAVITGTESLLFPLRLCSDSLNNDDEEEKSNPFIGQGTLEAIMAEEVVEADTDDLLANISLNVAEPDNNEEPMEKEMPELEEESPEEEESPKLDPRYPYCSF